jgi:hypothetical protein
LSPAGEPGGIKTVRDVPVEEEEVAILGTPPKITVLYMAVVLKFVPVIITSSPIKPVVGVTLSIVGTNTMGSLSFLEHDQTNAIRARALTQRMVNLLQIVTNFIFISLRLDCFFKVRLNDSINILIIFNMRNGFNIFLIYLR